VLGGGCGCGWVDGWVWVCLGTSATSSIGAGAGYAWTMGRPRRGPGFLWCSPEVCGTWVGFCRSPFRLGGPYLLIYSPLVSGSLAEVCGSPGLCCGMSASSVSCSPPCLSNVGVLSVLDITWCLSPGFPSSVVDIQVALCPAGVLPRRITLG
jgi:hypothetical protein